MRWFRVIADRFDWMPTPRTMISYPRGHVGYGTRACVAAGLARGAIEAIRRPAGYRIDKDGKVRRNG